MGVLQVPWDYFPRIIPDLVPRLTCDEPAHLFERTLGFQVAVQVSEQHRHQSQTDEKPLADQAPPF